MRRLLHSRPKSTVGSLLILLWRFSLGENMMASFEELVTNASKSVGGCVVLWVTLSVMLVGAYPFEDPKNFRKTQCITISQNYGSSIQDPQLCPHNSGLIAVISSLAYLLQIQSKKGKLPLKDADGKQKRSLTPEAKYNFCPSAWSPIARWNR
uniref:Uncharacterized protein n=1 Tax=Salix viminalis TaxID=40686 RepID=A0A6N2N6J3_SALVM